MATQLQGRRFSWNLAIIPVILALVVISLINLRNADFYTGDLYHQKQIVWYLLFGIVGIVVAILDIKIFERLAWPTYIVTVILLFLVLIWGKEVNYSKRWIEFLGFAAQPSEFMKISLIVLMASLLKQMHKPEFHNLRSLWKVLLVVAPPAGLILAEPDLGTTLLILFTAATMVIYEGVRLKSVALLLGVVLLVVPLAWQFDLIHDYQKNRVRLWMDPESFKWDAESKRQIAKTLQPEQALWSIGAGGFLGKGSMEGSKNRLKYLPEMQTDFILATYAEEHGFVGCSLLVLLYSALFLWGAFVARHATDRFGVLVAVGVTSYLFWQTFINIGMVTSMLPVVGITLPFMSYGGSSLLSLMVGLGLLVNIALHRGRT